MRDSPPMCPSYHSKSVLTVLLPLYCGSDLQYTALSYLLWGWWHRFFFFIKTTYLILPAFDFSTWFFHYQHLVTSDEKQIKKTKTNYCNIDIFVLHNPSSSSLRSFMSRHVPHAAKQDASSDHSRVAERQVKTCNWDINKSYLCLKYLFMYRLFLLARQCEISIIGYQPVIIVDK